MLGLEELEQLIEDIRIRILEANRKGTLEELLAKLDMGDLLKPPSTFESYRKGKIVTIGGSEVKENVLRGIAGKAGIDKNRLEFCLDYKEAEKYNYKKLQYTSEYRVVLVGAMPHSSTGKGDSSSVITEMENGEGYPRVVRLCSNDSLKITKSNFKKAIEALIAENYIEV